MVIHDKLILCDVDSVLLNWLDPFNSFMHTSGFVEAFGLNVDKNAPKDAYDLDNLYDVSDAAIFSMIKIFNNTLDVGNLPPTEGAVNAVKTLVLRGYTFHALSSFSDNEAAYELRKQNLINVFGPGAFTGFTFLPLRASKKDYLNTFGKSIVKPLVWIDDLFHHAKAGADAGMNAVCFDYYNVISGAGRAEIAFPVISTWPYLMNHIEDLYARSGN